MKKIIVLGIIFLFLISCSPEDDTKKVHYDLLAIDSIEMPVVFNVNTENNIRIIFSFPTSCHGFDGFLYEKNENTRTVAIQSYVLEENSCNPSNNQVVQILKFLPTTTGVFLFKFWKGKDINGDDIFEEISIEVQ